MRISDWSSDVCSSDLGTPYLPGDAFARAKVWQWLSFEQERIESQVGALRHWTLTGKLARRAPALVDAKRKGARRGLEILDAQFAARDFIAGDDYTIADIALFASFSRVAEADGASLDPRKSTRLNSSP